MVASRAHPGVLYAHTDSGAGAIFYGMTVAGASLGTFTLTGATATDWGDISPGGDSIILRTYTAIWLWCRGSTWASTFGAAPTELPSASEPKGEGLTFSSDGKAWYSAGETATTIYQASASCSS